MSCCSHWPQRQQLRSKGYGAGPCGRYLYVYIRARVSPTCPTNEKNLSFKIISLEMGWGEGGDVRVVASSLSRAQLVMAESVVAVSVPPTPTVAVADSMTGLVARAPLAVNR